MRFYFVDNHPTLVQSFARAAMEFAPDSTAQFFEDPVDFFQFADTFLLNEPAVLFLEMRLQTRQDGPDHNWQFFTRTGKAVLEKLRLEMPDGWNKVPVVLLTNDNDSRLFAELRRDWEGEGTFWIYRKPTKDEGAFEEVLRQVTEAARRVFG